MVLCAVCGKPFAHPDDPAVVEIPERPAEAWGWAAFLDDWRGPCRVEAYRISCIRSVLQNFRISVLIEVIHRRERIDRDGFWKLIGERDQLRAQLKSRRL